jgi:hypothetical protein
VSLQRNGKKIVFPYKADRLERFPALLKILIKTFPPNEYALMACRISTAILAIITTKFFGLEVILLEDPAARATFLYNELGQLDI